MPRVGGDQGGEDGGGDCLSVWWINWLAVEVFLACQPQVIGGMGIHWRGVSAVEIRAACDLMHVAPDDWPELLEDVQYMAHVVAAEHNRRAAEQANRRR